MQRRHAPGRTLATGRPAAARSSAIVGGSRAQRELLRHVLATLAPTHIAAVRIVRARGGVKLSADVRAIRPTWQLLVAGAAFLYRSAEQHLPPLLEVSSQRGAWLTRDAGPRPPRATRARVASARARMRRLAQESGARRAELTVSQPDGIAVALGLRVRNSARFLHHRMRRLALRAEAHASRYDGLLLYVVDRRGIAWANGETRLGGESYIRRRLAGCNPLPVPTPTPTLPPCPPA